MPTTLVFAFMYSLHSLRSTKVERPPNTKSMLNRDMRFESTEDLMCSLSCLEEVPS